MTFQAWPATLPQLPLKDGYVESFPDTIFRTPMDVGPAKHRRRATAVARPVVYPIFLETSALVDILLDFYETDLIGGTLPFTHDHPRTGVADTLFRFTGAPEIVPRGLGFQLELPLEIMP
jgi:hypothetical protein